MYPIQLGVNSRESIVQSGILAIKMRLHSIKAAIHMCHHALKPYIHMSLEPMLHLLKIRIKIARCRLLVLSLLLSRWRRRHLLGWMCLRLSSEVICMNSLIIMKAMTNMQAGTRCKRVNDFLAR